MQELRTAERRSWQMDGGPLRRVPVWAGWFGPSHPDLEDSEPVKLGAGRFPDRQESLMD